MNYGQESKREAAGNFPGRHAKNFDTGKLAGGDAGGDPRPGRTTNDFRLWEPGAVFEQGASLSDGKMPCPMDRDGAADASDAEFYVQLFPLRLHKGFEYGISDTSRRQPGGNCGRDGTGGKEERRHGISLFFQYPHREGEKGMRRGDTSLYLSGNGYLSHADRRASGRRKDDLSERSHPSAVRRGGGGAEYYSGG